MKRQKVLVRLVTYRSESGKVESKEVLLGFPEVSANSGRIMVYSEKEGHSEAGIDFFQAGKNLKTDEAMQYLKRYCNTGLESVDDYRLMKRMNMNELNKMWRQKIW